MPILNLTVTLMRIEINMLKKCTRVFVSGLAIVALSAVALWHLPSMQDKIFKYRHYYYKVFYPNNVNELLRRAYQTFSIPKAGVIHIGARYAEELNFYKHHALQDILWIEADPEAEQQLQQIISKHSGSKIAMFAATDTNGYIDLHKTSNDGHSSSILKLKNHSVYYPGIVEAKVLNVPQRRLDDYLAEHAELQNKYNTLVMDIQGAELIALKGAVKTLENIDAIVTETNYNELYEGATFIKAMDDFLEQHDFIRVDSSSCTHYTGDALYVKTKYLNVLNETFKS